MPSLFTLQMIKKTLDVLRLKKGYANFVETN